MIILITYSSTYRLHFNSVLYITNQHEQTNKNQFSKTHRHKKKKQQIKSHNHTTRGVLVAKRRGITNFSGASTCEPRHMWIILGVPNVPNRSSIIVDTRRVRVSHNVVRNKRVKLSSFTGPVNDPSHHSVWLNVTNHSHFLSIGLDGYISHSFHSF